MGRRDDARPDADRTPEASAATTLVIGTMPEGGAGTRGGGVRSNASHGNFRVGGTSFVAFG